MPKYHYRLVYTINYSFDSHDDASARQHAMDLFDNLDAKTKAVPWDREVLTQQGSTDNILARGKPRVDRKLIGPDEKPVT